VLLLDNEQLTGDRLPYLDACEDADDRTCDEYPVLTMYAMRVTAWISNTDPGYFYVNALLLGGVAVLVTGMLYRSIGSRALYFAAAPTLLMYASLNWDLVPVALATAGTIAYLRRRDIWSGVLLGLGAAAKVYPALFVLGFVVGRFRGREPDRGIHLAWAATGSWLAVNLPFIVSAPRSWWTFFSFSSRRDVWFDSLWYVACQRLTGRNCTNVRAVTVGSLVVFIASVAILWWVKRRRDPGFARWTLGFPILIAFLLSNKVYSPQYSLWLLPWFALAMPNLRLFLAFELSDVAVFLSEFSLFARFGGHAGVTEGTFELAVVMRAAVLIACVVTWIRARVVDTEGAPAVVPVVAAA
jgi:uncharacterized membrane protein